MVNVMLYASSALHFSMHSQSCLYLSNLCSLSSLGLVKLLLLVPIHSAFLTLTLLLQFYVFLIPVFTSIRIYFQYQSVLIFTKNLWMLGYLDMIIIPHWISTYLPMFMYISNNLNSKTTREPLTTEKMGLCASLWVYTHFNYLRDQMPNPTLGMQHDMDLCLFLKESRSIIWWLDYTAAYIRSFSLLIIKIWINISHL